jgi:hypothetical protein
MSDHRVTLAEVVRAQVATIFGKWRPAAGLEAAEAAAVLAERRDFADRLTSFVRAIEAPEPAVIQRVRDVTRSIYNDPNLRNLPTPEAIALQVKQVFVAKQRQRCVGCIQMGGYYMSADVDAILHNPLLGDLDYGPAGTLCIAHHEVAHYFEAREERRRRGVLYRYPPPFSMLPRGSHNTPSADLWRAYLDGADQGPMAKWARGWLEKERGVEFDAQVVETAPTSQETLGRDDWQGV